MIYGYCRVSTKKQVISRQRENIIRAYSDVKIYEEVYTGTTSNRPAWQKLLKIVRTGDTIVFDSVSRMSRNADEGIKQYFELYEQGIELVFLKERYINTAVYTESINQRKINLVGDETDIILKAIQEYLNALARKQIVIAFEQSEKEVKDLQQRTREGMKSKNASEKISKAKLGKKYNTAKSQKVKKIILKHSRNFQGSLTDEECMTLAQCSRYTYYKYKKEMLSEYDLTTGQQMIKE